MINAALLKSITVFAFVFDDNRWGDVWKKTSISNLKDITVEDMHDVWQEWKMLNFPEQHCELILYLALIIVRFAALKRNDKTSNYPTVTRK